MQFDLGKFLGKCSIYSWRHSHLNMRCQCLLQTKGVIILFAKKMEAAISSSAVKLRGLSLRQDQARLLSQLNKNLSTDWRVVTV